MDYCGLIQDTIYPAGTLNSAVPILRPMTVRSVGPSEEIVRLCIVRGYPCLVTIDDLAELMETLHEPDKDDIKVEFDGGAVQARPAPVPHRHQALIGMAADALKPFIDGLVMSRRQGQVPRCGLSTPYELQEVGMKLAVTANSFTGRADDDSMKGFADVSTFFRQVEAAIFDGGEPPAADVGYVGNGALSERGVAVALIGQLSDSAFQLLHIREVQTI